MPYLEQDQNLTLVGPLTELGDAIMSYHQQSLAASNEVARRLETNHSPFAIVQLLVDIRAIRNRGEE